ncbi:hypothetical protein Q9290_09935 [Oceanimonas sp. CHS3-5]|uniref:F0F1 ATP synthase subunit epsilon n=1 Tax=Oceanimonas sp. CHS3-5 TaxID=3068186 RepID=UPI00273F3603|nr:hypothetical protein [Oceanimonas sp. CHS3-5]MDP5292603.1 hypothetical protein [Oceanimonas sp. CHS3-5]
MTPFILTLQDATHAETVEDVTAFVGEDDSGSFSLLARHAPLVTVLTVGLARFRTGEQHWHYLALPGAVLHFEHNVLTLSTRRYWLDDDYQRISTTLQQCLLAEEEALHGMKESLRRLEDECLRRMWELGRRGGGPML